jgi:hypothetical protein
MQKKGLLILAATMLLTAFQVSAQDISEGTILAYDRKANILILTDRSVFPLEKLTSAAPDGLKAGDRVNIQYDSNEDDGITAIHSIKVIPK